MSIKLSGRDVKKKIQQELSLRISRLSERPTLQIMMAGNDPASLTYIEHKQRFAGLIGARVFLERFPPSVSSSQLIAAIHRANTNPDIHGIIVQLPLPDTVKPTDIIQSIDPAKDVDGLTYPNIGKLLSGTPLFVPATAGGILRLLDHYDISLAGKHVVIVGRSSLVGLPMAHLALQRDATVCVTHSKTADLARICREADIIISATGQPGLISPDHVTSNSIVIDVGISRKADKITGDFDERAANTVHAYSPVPGGIGPMTIASLFLNLVEACERHIRANTPPQ